jgi:hypothetical protein
MRAATIVDVSALLKTVLWAFVSGVGVTVMFSIAVLGAARFADMNRDGRPAAAAAFGALTVIGLVTVGAVVAIGIIVMASK